jgi:LuxR family transcriptional regulator, maltose regulon positive regulatory protein
MSVKVAGDHGYSGARTSLIDRTKLRMPAAPPETLAREQVSDALDRLTRGRFVMLCAPAGSGKTTAVINWARARGAAVAWLSLDRFDNDPRRFVWHLVQSLDQAFPGTMAEALERIDAGADLQRRCLPRVIDALRGVEPLDLAIVLDDYHLVESEACHAFVRALVAAMPPGGRLVGKSRTPLPPELDATASAGLDADDLAFNHWDTVRLLNGNFGLGLDRAELHAVHSTLAGWPVGLSLLALSQTGIDPAGRDLRSALDALAGREVAEYLAEEVLDDLDPGERRFLLETSILERLSAPLCEAVLDDPVTGRLLAHLQAAGRFVVDDGSGWLRMHDLVRESFRTLLARRSPERVVTLNQRASQWFEQAGRPRDALEHAIAAGDGPRCGRLIGDYGVSWLRWTDWHWVRTALDRIPDTGPEFADGVEALDLHIRTLEGVDLRVLLPRARALLEQHPEDADVQAMVAPICINQFTGDVGRGIRTARAVLERVPHIRHRPGFEIQMASSLWSAGELDAALATTEAVLEAIEPAVAPAVPVFAHATLSRIWADRGDAERAEYHARRAVEPIIRAGAESLSAWGSVWICLGEALRLAGKLEEARIHQDFGMEQERRRPGAVGLGWALISEAQLALAERRPELARASARRAREILETYPDPGAQLFKRLGEVEALLAARAVEALPGSVPTDAEMRILTLLAAGASRKQIAQELYLSDNTIKSHLRRIYRRLEVSSRAEAVDVARARGLLDQIVS